MTGGAPVDSARIYSSDCLGSVPRCSAARPGPGRPLAGSVHNGPQAEGIHPQPLPAQGHTTPPRQGHPASFAAGTSLSDIDVCGGLRPNLGQSITSRVTWGQPPDNRIPQSGHCSTRWVGVMRVRAKPGRRGLRGCLGRSGFPGPLDCRPGIPLEPTGLALPSSVAMRRSSWAMTANKTSREAGGRSTYWSLSLFYHKLRDHPLRPFSATLT